MVRIFIGCSTEALEIARLIQTALEHDAVVSIWNQGVFEASHYTLNDLHDAARDHDIAVFILHPDDKVEIRKAPKQITRDNVILELGLFIGLMGIERVLMVQPRDIVDLQVPTDLFGLQPITYDSTKLAISAEAAMGAAVSKIRERAKNVGVKSPQFVVASQPRDYSHAYEALRLALQREHHNLLQVKVTNLGIPQAIKEATESHSEYVGELMKAEQGGSALVHRLLRVYDAETAANCLCTLEKIREISGSTIKVQLRETPQIPLLNLYLFGTSAAGLTFDHSAMQRLSFRATSGSPDQEEVIKGVCLVWESLWEAEGVILKNEQGVNAKAQATIESMAADA